MSGVMEAGMEKDRGSGAPSGEPEASREVRWSARRKEEVVLRLLRGDTLDLLAREAGQPAGRIAAWREEFSDKPRGSPALYPFASVLCPLASTGQRLAPLWLTPRRVGRNE